MPPEVYLDMDGVLCNFESQCRKLFRKDFHHTETLDEFIQRHTKKKFWISIHQTQGLFWSTMEPLNENTLEIVEKFKESCSHVHILSAPAKDPNCVAGKNLWLDKYIGEDIISKRIFDVHKYKYASPGRILVDDNRDHINKWIQGGGTGILFDTKRGFD